MAIIGKPFEDYVTRQINLRQKLLGEGFGILNPSRKIETLNVYNSSTPWMRLASAVSITEGLKDLPGKSVYEQIETSGLFDGIPSSTWKGTGLAKSFVLQGAPNNQSGKASPSGVNVKNQGGAYGWGYGTNQLNSLQGYVPPPGVTSVDFDYKGDGGIANATINIKAFSATQFSMIDILYMRPGYTCLLEFGHSVYYKNTNSNLDPELVNLDTSMTSPFEYVFRDRPNSKSSSTSYTEMAEIIQKEKKKHDGNYEGFFGRISKFNWKFNMDGSYDITVKLMGLGDVITSLKTSIPKMTTTPSTFNSSFELKPLPSGKEQRENNKEAEEEKAFIISDALESQLNFELYSIFSDQLNFSDKKSNVLSNVVAVADSVSSTSTLQNPGFAGLSLLSYFFEPEDFQSNVNFSHYPITMSGIPVGVEDRTYTIPAGVVKFDVNDWGFTKFSPITLIKFGVFLSMLQKICNITDGEDNTLLQFEMVNDISQGLEKQLIEDNTFIVTYPGNFSSNPNTCLIKYSDYDYNVMPNQELDTTHGINEVLTKISSEGENNAIQNLPNPRLAMRLSDVYININFITQVLRNLRGTDNESENEVDVSIIDLLRGILSGVNTSLGGLNNFRVVYSEETSQIQIHSEIPILSQNIDTPTETLSTINTFGFDTTDKQLVGGSFVTSMDLNSELTDQMATQISIGAQNDSNTINGNSMAYSTYSKGLVDTLMKEKKSPLKKSSTLNEIQQKVLDNPEASIEGLLLEISKATSPLPPSIPSSNPSLNTTLEKIDAIFDESEFHKAFQQVYQDREFDPENYIPILEKSSLNVSSLINGEYVKSSQSPSPFFLPFNLSLEMRGLGGMKIFDAFSINGKGLPLSYNPKTIKLIIKNLSHTISLDGWKTKISTLPQPVYPVKSISPTGRPSSSTPSGEYTKRPLTLQLNGKTLTNGKLDGYTDLIDLTTQFNSITTQVNQSDGQRVRLLNTAAPSFVKMYGAAKADGVQLYINSVYRTYEDQVRVANTFPPEDLGKKVAYPGTSSHGFGKSIDLASTIGGAKLSRASDQYKWLKDHAKFYGFFEDVPNEPWHWTFKGITEYNPNISPI